MLVPNYCAISNWPVFTKVMKKKYLILFFWFSTSEIQSYIISIVIEIKCSPAHVIILFSYKFIVLQTSHSFSLFSYSAVDCISKWKRDFFSLLMKIKFFHISYETGHLNWNHYKLKRSTCMIKLFWINAVH